MIHEGFKAPTEPYKASYNIRLHVDPIKAAFTGKQIVTFENMAPFIVSRLALEFDLSDGARLKLFIGERETGSEVRLFKSHVESVLWFELAKPLGCMEEICLYMEFSGSIPDEFSKWMGDGGMTVLKRYYPKLWWGYPVSDSYEVEIMAPDSYTVVCSGTACEDGLYRGENISSFGIVLYNTLKVISGNTGDEANVTVYCHYIKEYSECARLLLESALDAIRYYYKVLGFYPYRILHILPGHQHWQGGFPLACGMVGIHNQQDYCDEKKDGYRWITAHEIGHQYFGEYVLDPDDPPWLWVGLGLYLDSGYINERGMKPTWKDRLKSVAEAAENGVDTLISLPVEELEAIQGNSRDRNTYKNLVVHNKSFSVVKMLECLIGAEAMHKLIERCFALHGGKRMGLGEFKALCENETGVSLGWFFKQWTNSRRYLSYRITNVEVHKHAETYSTAVTIEKLGNAQMPVTVEARFSDGSRSRAVSEVLADVQEIGFQSDFKFTEVILDPDGVLPLLQKPLDLDRIEFVRKIDKLPWGCEESYAMEILNSYLHFATNDISRGFKLALHLYECERYKEALNLLESMNKEALDDFYNDWFNIWKAMLYDILGHRLKAVTEYKSVLGKGFDREFRHDQFKLVINREWLEDRIKKPFSRIKD